jgi:hypothetical protein
MVKDASITAPVKPTEDYTGYEQRKREADFSDELQIPTSLFLSFMVNKSGNYNCRQPGIIIVVDHSTVIFG